MSVEIDHLGIAVRSLEEGQAFYEGLLGMRVSAHESVSAEKVNVAMLPAGSAADAPRIELLAASDGNSVISKYIENHGPGLHHIALRVDDLSAAVERLKAGGARILDEPRAGAGGHTYVFVHPASAGGVLIELIQK